MTAPAGTSSRRARLVHVPAKKGPAVRNEINVTPLVDVCLVLLIIFMVIMELLARGQHVDLPKTKHHLSEPDSDQPIVAVDQKGMFYFDREVMNDLASLKRRVEDEWRVKEQIERKVFIKADARLEYGKVYPLIMAMHELDVGAIDLGTNELKEDEEQ
jgi:biopolymer transport protein ExbD